MHTNLHEVPNRDRLHNFRKICECAGQCGAAYLYIYIYIYRSMLPYIQESSGGTST